MKPQILVVDDTEMIRRLLTMILSDTYNVVVKNNGIEAFRWLEEGNFPNLIISDMMMPYIDGTSFVRNLKISGYYNNTPVIVLSGVDDLENRIMNMPFKVERYVKKPFNPADLKIVIQQVLKENEIGSNTLN